MGSFCSSRGVVTGPFPITRLFHQSGTNRIQNNIPANLQEMAVFLDKDGLISALKEMACPGALFIVCLSIDTI